MTENEIHVPAADGETTTFTALSRTSATVSGWFVFDCDRSFRAVGRSHPDPVFEIVRDVLDACGGVAEVVGHEHLRAQRCAPVVSLAPLRPHTDLHFRILAPSAPVDASVVSWRGPTPYQGVSSGSASENSGNRPRNSSSATLSSHRARFEPRQR